MTQKSDDTGVILALMRRFNEQRLPIILEIKKRVDAGECLTDHDIEFIEQVFSDANHVIPILDRHPELQPVASRAVSLYKEITEKALENEKNT